MKHLLYTLIFTMSFSLLANHPLADFLGGITGATAAQAYNDCYPVNPNYDFVYPGVPIYAYDYPTQVYSPVYSYINTRYSVYPSYFFMVN